MSNSGAWMIWWMSESHEVEHDVGLIDRPVVELSSIVMVSTRLEKPVIVKSIHRSPSRIDTSC